MYDKIRLDEPWNSEHNRQFHDVQIRTFQCPSSSRSVRIVRSMRNIFIKNRELSRTLNCDYSVVIGEDTAFPGSTAITLKDITDGTSNTILIVERMAPVNWMDPSNEIRFENACKGINKHILGIGSEHHAGGAYVAFADGSVRFLLNDFEGIKPLLTRSAGDNCDPVHQNRSY